MENTFGLQIRNDWIHNGLFQTDDRHRVDKTDSATGAILPATVLDDRVTQTMTGLYYENKMQWAEKFRTVAGIRGDIYFYDVSASDPRNSGTASDALASPKLSLILGSWAKTELYAHIETVVAAGVTLHDLRGFNASLRLRYFGPRDLISTGAARSKETILLNLHVGYEINKNWSISADVFNLLDRRDHDIDYYYESRITPTLSARSQVHFHPVEPIQARFGITARF